MALRPLQAGKEPLGQFDGYDSEYLTLKGGEVGTFMSITYAFPGDTDHAAYDVYDGYTGYGTQSRVAITKTLTTNARPVFLLDEGTTGYGTLFGTTLGGAVGSIVPNPSSPSTTGATVLGPHTAWGSGKVTCWDKPGLYAVTLDAVETDLVPTLSISPGAPLYATSAGLLTSVGANSFAGVSTFPVGRFVEFSTNGSLVTTPPRLVGAGLQFTQIVLHFNPGV